MISCLNLPTNHKEPQPELLSISKPEEALSTNLKAKSPRAHFAFVLLYASPSILIRLLPNPSLGKFKNSQLGIPR